MLITFLRPLRNYLIFSHREFLYQRHQEPEGAIALPPITSFPHSGLERYKLPDLVGVVLEHLCVRSKRPFPTIF
jgi:hypothetical protein